MHSLSWPGRIFQGWIHSHEVWGRNWGLHVLSHSWVWSWEGKMRGGGKAKSSSPILTDYCVAAAVTWGSQTRRRTWGCWAGASLTSQAPSAPSRRWELPQCNISSGEMAEGLLQIGTSVTKSRIHPNDESCREGRAKGQHEGHQLQVLLPPKDRSSSLPGEPGRCQNLSVDAKRLPWCVSANI